jgi:alkylhydroperoxidase family enzyme
MPHIALTSAEPGIRGLLRYRPETGRPLSELAEVLLRGHLDPGPTGTDRGVCVGAQRLPVLRVVACWVCRGPAAGGMALVEQVRADPASAPVSAKLKTLLTLAAAVARSGHAVTNDDITQARAAGATDAEIHDTVLVAATFCMFNRYVDGLDTTAPDDPAAYAAGARRLVTQGYLPPPADSGRAG